MNAGRNDRAVHAIGSEHNKRSIGPNQSVQSRPFIEEHDKMFRFYEYWLKGCRHGVMDEPAVEVHDEGPKTHVTADTRPPKDVEYTQMFLRPRSRLSLQPEPMVIWHPPSTKHR